MIHYLRIIFLSLFATMSCSPEISINEALFLDRYWEIAEAQGSFEEYEGACFMLDTSNHELWFYDNGLPSEGPYYWDQVGENVFEIHDVGKIKIYPIDETKRLDWEIDINSFPVSTTIIAEKCNEF
jgi:hypothetical protein